MVRSAIVSVMSCGVVLTAGGCLITTGNSQHEMGVKVSESTLNNVVVGETTESWLVSALGEPSSRTNVEGQDGVQILRYDYTIKEESGGTLLFLFAGGSSKTSESRAYFEVTNGVVTRYWKEG